MNRRGMCTMPVTCMGGKTMSKMALFVSQIMGIVISIITLACVPMLTIAAAIAFSIAGALIIIAGACLAFDREGTK